MARQFNGTSDFAKSATTINLGSINTVTVAVWMKWDINANDDDAAMYFGVSGATDMFFWLPNHSGSGGKQDAGLRGNVGLSGASWTRPTAGTWHHYLLFFDKSTSSNEVIVWLDGASAPGLGNDGNNSDNTNNFGNNFLSLMANNSGALNGQGAMAGFGLWNRILTTGERATLSGGQRPVSVSSGLIVAFDMYAATGSTESDANGGGLVLNYTGTTMTSDPPSLVAPGGGNTDTSLAPNPTVLSQFTGFF